MSIQDLPGYSWATENGWVLHFYSGNRRSANYMNEAGVGLKMEKNQATLVVTDGLVISTLGPFSFPHKNFDRFVEYISRHLPEEKTVSISGEIP